jgi:serine protease inhibitor
MNTTLRVVATGLLATALGACESSTGSPDPLDALPRPLTVTEQSVIAGSNGFAWGLLREEANRAPGHNVFVSPLSVSMALGMTANGARGSTASQIHSALGFGAMTQEEINGAYRGLKDLLLGLDPSVDTRIANSVWYRQEFPFEATFFNTVSQAFDAEVNGVDFENAGTKDQINEWVSQETGGRIPTILEEIGPQQVMYLINAVYFKGSWSQRFDRSATENQPFHRGDGSSVSVPMMAAADMPVRFGVGQHWSAADLAYGNGAFAMTVVVPREGTTLDQLASEMDAAGWASLVGTLQPQNVPVRLPRFRIEWKDDLKTGLRALGINDAFDYADFTGMSASRGRELLITEVLHKTFVEVNEEGTEAAAATSVGVGVTSIPIGLVADRPFLVVIRERFSGTILFLGRIEDPR